MRKRLVRGKPSTQTGEIATAIAEQLFHVGNDPRAARLVLEYDLFSYEGAPGWGYEEAVIAIRSILDKKF